MFSPCDHRDFEDNNMRVDKLVSNLNPTTICAIPREAGMDTSLTDIRRFRCSPDQESVNDLTHARFSH